MDIRTQPRFGWFDPTHRAINLGAIHQLPGSTPKEAEWKQFLLDRFTVLMAADSMRDVQYDGPTHYTDVAERGNGTAATRSPYNTPGYALWKAARKTFTKKNMDALQADLKTHPLTPGQPGDPPSLFRDIQEAYDTVKKELNRFDQGLPRLQQILTGDPAHDTPLIQAATDDLIKNVGWLTHMTGDASMPLHTASAIGDYPLEPHPKMGTFTFADGIHGLIEGDLLTDADHAALVSNAQKAPRLNSSFYNQDDLFREVFTPQLVESYMLNREIMLAHKNALNDKSEINRPQLQARLKELLVPHLQKAQTRLAWVLHSIWKQAGEPTFEITPPAPVQTP